jgi:mono/diheme cytochrome c family protein
MKKLVSSQLSFRLLVVSLVLTLALVGCGGSAASTEAPASGSGVAEATPTDAETEPAAPAGTASFSKDIQPIFNASCSSCHGNRASGGVQLNSYESLMSSNVVSAGDSAGSVLWQVVDSGVMPKAGQRLSAEQVQLIADWINAGANND